MKKIIGILALWFVSSGVFATDFNQESVSFSDMLFSWSKVINKKVIINLPEEEQFSFYIPQNKQIILDNESQLPCAIEKINNLYARKNVKPIHACLFSNALVIEPINKNCGEN